MHVETLARIERSLRATTDGHLRWLQGSKGVLVPLVDNNQPTDAVATLAGGAGYGYNNNSSSSGTSSTPMSPGGSLSLSLSMHTPRETPHASNDANASFASPLTSTFVTPPRRPPLTMMTSSSSSTLSPPYSSTMAAPAASFDSSGGQGEGAGVGIAAGAAPSSGGLGLGRASSGLRGLAGLMGRRYLHMYTQYVCRGTFYHAIACSHDIT